MDVSDPRKAWVFSLPYDDKAHVLVAAYPFSGACLIYEVCVPVDARFR